MKFIRDIIAERSEAKSSATESSPPFPTEEVSEPIAVSEPEIVPSVDTETASVVPPEEAAEVSKAPEPIEAPAPGITPSFVPRRQYRDRTITRLSDSVIFDEDDVFKRLLGEEAASQIDTVSNEKEKSSLPFEDETPDDEANLFNDLDLNLDGKDNAAPDLEEPPVPEFVRRRETPAEPWDLPETQDRLDTVEQPETLTTEADIDPDLLRPAPLPEAKGPEVGEPIRQKPDHGVAFSGLPGRSAQAEHAERMPETPGLVSVPAPASGRSGRGAGRVKTRLLGFGSPEAPMHDPFKGSISTECDTSDVGSETAEPAPASFPVGWLVVTAGPGRGSSFALQNGVSQIGRGADQAVRLDFGDTSISRSNHAAIAYDEEQGGFYLGHGGKANMVRLNDRPVLSTEELKSGALIRIGETTLRFVALCDESFSWNEAGI